MSTLFSVPPAKYETYTGKRGSMHGDTNAIIPSEKLSDNPYSLLLLGLLSFDFYFSPVN